MAFDGFLKLDGITGESKDAAHKGEIDLSSFSWGEGNDVTIGSATSGAGAGKAKFDEIKISKHVDAASPLLLTACATGQHIKTGLITVRKAGGTQLEYLKISMNLVLISDIQQKAASGDDRVSEEITIVAGSIQVQYQQQGPDGKAKGGPNMAAWNVVTNTDNPTIPGL